MMMTKIIPRWAFPQEVCSPTLVFLATSWLVALSFGETETSHQTMNQACYSGFFWTMKHHDGVHHQEGDTHQSMLMELTAFLPRCDSYIWNSTTPTCSPSTEPPRSRSTRLIKSTKIWIWISGQVATLMTSMLTPSVGGNKIWGGIHSVRPQTYKQTRQT